MENLSNLKFRRQFLFSPEKCKELESWKSIDLESHFLYVHPDCELNRVTREQNELVLIGHAINPHDPEKTSQQVLLDIADFSTIGDVPRYLYPLVGRFVLLIKQNGVFTFFNDACGLRSVYYLKDGNNFYAASQPLLFKLVFNIVKSANYYSYYQSQHVKSVREYWLPSGVSLYKNVFHLAANHYVDSLNTRQIRYWPNKLNEKKNMDTAVEKISFLLRNTMIAAKKRWKLALSLTAGLDSRTILSSSHDIIDDVLVYTLQYRDLTEESNDMRIPRKLASRLGFQYQVMDCRTKFNEDFSDIYIDNTALPHYNDWGKIANGLFAHYPQERVAVKGNATEIGRHAYHHSGRQVTIHSGNQLLPLVKGWSEIEFIKTRLSEWFEEIKDYSKSFGYSILDLFYWEQRMNSWQAQSQLEWDIVQEVFTPYNNRELIDLTLAVDPKFRCAPDYLLFQKLIQKQWNEALSEPINPTTPFKRLKSKLKEVLLLHEINNSSGHWKSN
jgi:hypothetical protein